MLCDEPWLELLNDRVEEWSTGLALQLVRAGVDAIWFGEDLGSQTSTLIAPMTGEPGLNLATKG